MENKVMKSENEVSMFNMHSVGTMVTLSKTLAEATIIPTTFQNSPANVLIALNMAQRMNADPLMIMQNMYIVNGNPSFSSKFLIACFNTCGRFTSIKYEFFGKPGTDEYGCRAYATEKATNEKVKSVDVTIGMAKAEGWVDKKLSKWKTMPQLMLQYRSAAFLIRTVAPEISMGLQTTEELQETIELTPDGNGSFAAEKQAVDNEVKAVAEKAAVIDIPVENTAPAPEKVAVTTAKKTQPSWMND